MKRYKSPSDIKVGVIGYGGAFNMGRAHLREMQAAGMTPVAVAEIDESRLAVAADDFPGIGQFSTVKAMLKESDVTLVTIITPHNTHAPLAIECLRAGRHVVCEKPLAITTAEVDRMIAAAGKSGLMLSTYHNRHWDGRALLAVDLVKRKGLIGDIVRIDIKRGGFGNPGDWWRTSRTISGGILYDWGVHLLEYSLQLIDAEVTEVTGFAHEGFWASKTKWKDDTNEDEARAIVRFDSGQNLSLTMSQLDSNPTEDWLEVTGTQGTFLMGSTASTLIRRQGGKKVTTEYPNPEDQSRKYYQNIADHMVVGAPLVITPEWSRRPIHILDLAVRSAKKGKSLKAKYG